LRQIAALIDCIIGIAELLTGLGRRKLMRRSRRERGIAKVTKKPRILAAVEAEFTRSA
jgi:hypothetical protein